MDFASLLIKADSTQVEKSNTALQKIINTSIGVDAALLKISKGFNSASSSASIFEKAFQRGEQVTASMLKPLEIYEKELSELSKLLSLGAIDHQTYWRAVDNAKMHLDQAGSSMQKNDRIAGMLSNSIKGLVLTYASFYGLRLAKDAIMGTVDAMDNMNESSQKIGISVEALKALQYAASTTGVGAEDLNSSIKFLNKNIADSKKEFDLMGISVRDSNGGMKSSSEVLGEVADKFSSYKDGAGKTALAMELFSRSGMNMIPMLNKGRDGVKELTDEAVKLGVVFSGETAKAADEFNDNMIKLKATFDGITTKLVSQLLPGMLEFLRLINGESKDMIETTMTIDRAAKESASVATSVLSERLRDVVQAGREASAEAERLKKLADGAAAWDTKAGSYGEHIATLAREKYENAAAGVADYKKQIDMLNDALKPKGTVSEKADAPSIGSPIKSGKVDNSALQEDIALFEKMKQLTESINTPYQNFIKSQNDLSGVFTYTNMSLESRNTIMKAMDERYLNSIGPLNAAIEAEKIYRDELNKGAISIDEYNTKLLGRQQAFDAAAKKEIDAITQANQARVDALYSGLLTEEEQIAQSYERRRAKILEETSITVEQRKDLEVRNQNEKNYQLKSLSDKAMNDEVSAYSKVFDSVTSLTEQFAGNQSGIYKVMFTVSKSFALAEAAIKMGQAMADSGATTPGPAKFASIVSTGVQMAAIIGEIAAVNFAGAKDKGGSIPAGKWGIAGEFGPEIVSGPAMVTSRSDTSKMLSKGGNVKIINVIDPSVVSDWAQTDDGERVIMNTIRRNQGEIASYVY